MGSLLVDGLKAVVITMVYGIVPMLLYVVVVFGLLGTGAAIGGDGRGMVAGLGILSLFLFLPVMVLIYYVVPAALTNFAREGSIGAAFAFDRIKPVDLSVDYLLAVLFPLVIAVLLQVVLFVLAITVIGLLLAPFVYFYAQVAIFRMFGAAYAKVDGERTREDLDAAAVA